MLPFPPSRPGLPMKPEVPMPISLLLEEVKVFNLTHQYHHGRLSPQEYQEFLLGLQVLGLLAGPEIVSNT
ncbi:hypothetical protein E2C01_036840 [Portunus trituberculatus]|uniref:Uncharacterized protein n=1 Tax=Portunus trituberculatus TaxID=210409 RepID=A0A5B7F6I2_PORTR|nr:hypothetical protein [Portunus trituberculatus]